MSRPRRPSETVPAGVYEALSARQGHVCAICGSSPKTRRHHIDHNHRTGQTRGLLCHRCNRALPGEELLPKDQPPSAWLFAAMVYVAGYEAQDAT